MASRGVLVSYETIRRWCEKFGHLYVAGLRKRRLRTGDKWYLDEVFLNINGMRHYLWRAVDQNGVVIDILVQPKRDRFAAMRFFRKLWRATARRRPRVIVTDKLRSYERSPPGFEVEQLRAGVTCQPGRRGPEGVRAISLTRTPAPSRIRNRDKPEQRVDCSCPAALAVVPLPASRAFPPPI